jgi:hypothetical protein
MVRANQTGHVNPALWFRSMFKIKVPTLEIQNSRVRISETSPTWLLIHLSPVILSEGNTP